MLVLSYFFDWMRKLKRFSEAIPHFRQAALVKPGNLKVQFGLGQAYTGIGKTRLASAAFARAAELEPGNADAWYHLGVSYLEQVEADARVLLGSHAGLGLRGDADRGNISRNSGLCRRPKKPIRRCLFFPIPAGAHAGYGFVLLYRHSLEGAKRELNAEFEANPGSLMAKLGLARLHLEQGAGEKAAREMEKYGKTILVLRGAMPGGSARAWLVHSVASYWALARTAGIGRHSA